MRERNRVRAELCGRLENKHESVTASEPEKVAGVEVFTQRRTELCG